MKLFLFMLIVTAFIMVLKLTGTWVVSWWVVFSPLLIWFGVGAALTALVGLVYVMSGGLK